ncbi:MAG TPA: hypothetical protein VIQ80_01865 [Candidatus Saccharimonadales bacterium]
MPRLTPGEEKAEFERQQAISKVPVQDIAPRSYLVTLKSGKTGVFTNNGNFPNYKDMLLSGVYNITDRRDPKAIVERITMSNVVSIDEISGDVASGETQVGQDD